MNVIRDAITLLTESGMAKMRARNDSGQMCVGGAVSLAASGSEFLWVGERFQEAMSLVGQVAWAQYPERLPYHAARTHCDRRRLEHELGDAVEFNNHPDTTQDELLAIMEKAAVMLDEADALR